MQRLKGNGTQKRSAKACLTGQDELYPEIWICLAMLQKKNCSGQASIHQNYMKMTHNYGNIIENFANLFNLSSDADPLFASFMIYSICCGFRLYTWTKNAHFAQTQ